METELKQENVVYNIEEKEEEERRREEIDIKAFPLYLPRYKAT